MRFFQFNSPKLHRFSLRRAARGQEAGNGAEGGLDANDNDLERAMERAYEDFTMVQMSLHFPPRDVYYMTNEEMVRFPQFTDLVRRYEQSKNESKKVEAAAAAQLQRGKQVLQREKKSESTTAGANETSASMWTVTTVRHCGHSRAPTFQAVYCQQHQKVCVCVHVVAHQQLPRRLVLISGICSRVSRSRSMTPVHR